jgi:hypothetical protein
MGNCEENTPIIKGKKRNTTKEKQKHSAQAPHIDNDKAVMRKRLTI